MLSFRQLLFRNLLFFRRTNLAVIFGVIAATAAISGALIVGDSVRSSLRQMTLDRLGDIDQAINGSRFFRQELAGDVLANQKEMSSVAPALMMPGTIEFQLPNGDKRRAGNVNVTGCDELLWNLLEHGSITPPASGEIVLNQRVAEDLGVAVGDEVTLIVEVPSSIPRDALLGERNETITAQPAKVSAIIPDELGLSRFGLNPTQQLPPNAFVPLYELQALVGLNAVARSRSQPIEKPARVNALFFSGTHSSGAQSGELNEIAISPEMASQLTSVVATQLKLSDFSLRLVEHNEHGYLSLESEQMFLEDLITSAVKQASDDLKIGTSPVLVSLINEIWKSETPDKYSMYSVVAGIDASKSPPFGPFTFVGESRPLTGKSVYLNDWLAKDLDAKVGETIKVKYHLVGDRGELPEAEQEFTVAGIVQLTGPAKDSGYTPYVPGVTDAKSYADWKEPFPLKKDRITDRDDEYWEEYTTTPKMFVSLETAQELWGSRYGKLTSIRFAPRARETLQTLKDKLAAALLEQLHPQRFGLAVQPIKYQGLAAANGSTDFTGLFIGFSFFVILSAAILTGLLFRLGVELRLSEIGLLQAIGLPPKFVSRMLFAEGMLLAILGVSIGTAFAIGYAWLMILGLKTWWIGAIGTRFLFMEVQPLSLCIGAAIALSVALIAIWWGQRQAKSQSPRALLLGSLSDDRTDGHPVISFWLTVIGGLGSVLMLAAALLGWLPDQEAFGGFSWKIVVFFLVGVGLLTSSLAAFSLLLSSPGRKRDSSNKLFTTSQLALRNASRNRSRSVLTASLIASATFVIVAVAAGQMNPTGAAPNPRSGNGGFTLVAESSVPLLYDLNTNTGRSKLGFDTKNAKQMELLNSAKVAPFRMRTGENASCLNLYQTQLPTILGVPDDVLDMLIGDNRFLFADTRAEHPWSLLKEELPQGHIPVLGDMNTLMYSLHKGIGQTIPVTEGATPQQTLQVVGMFANSVLQGVLVMSESNFRTLFPDQLGFRYFLIDVDPENAKALSTLLESQLGDEGFATDLVSQRMADFLAVQNTYLSTFQTLGGLGLLLGTFGLATVMLRNVLERAKEFALLQAVGFRKGQIARLVFLENALLLASGLFTGTASALLAMSPHLMTTVSSLPWGSLIAMLLGIFVIGMLASLGAVRAVVQLPLIATLRGE